MNLCDRCAVDATGELRTLWMSCFYNMSELKIPFKSIDINNVAENPVTSIKRYYTLRVCKECRASWLRSIETWFLYC